MKNYCVNVHFAKIFPVFYICWIVLYYVLIKWEGIDKIILPHYTPITVVSWQNYYFI